MILSKQYQFVQESRNLLFDFCKTISPEDFINENSTFGHGGSVRNLLVHIANCYEFWIAKRVLHKKMLISAMELPGKIDAVIDLFDYVDHFMNEYIEQLHHPDKIIEYEKNGARQSAASIKIFTHVITHEYHHKGQILSLGRHLGHIPVDTDILR